jgi:hypothetical protein
MVSVTAHPQTFGKESMPASPRLFFLSYSTPSSKTPMDIRSSAWIEGYAKVRLNDQSNIAQDRLIQVVKAMRSGRLSEEHSGIQAALDAHVRYGSGDGCIPGEPGCEDSGRFSPEVTRRAIDLELRDG